MASKKPSPRDKEEFENKAEPSLGSNIAHAAEFEASAPVEPPIVFASESAAERALESAAEPVVVPLKPPFETTAQRSSAALTEAVVTVDFSAPAKAMSQWQQTAVDIWSESAVALLDFASQLARATSISDVIELQSRFAQERFEGFARFSTDYAEFAQRAAKEAGAAAFRFARSA